jgi:glyoxylase-like metal-dependent hydrolase (beta-lactamase superfamily II)
VEQDGKGLVIDCGQLSPGGVVDQAKLDGCEVLLLTHFHRDQCGAASQWVREGVQVSIPFSEKRFFEEGDILRASYDIYDNYPAYFPTFSPLDDVRGEPITDYDSISWQGMDFQAIPLPGHTFGSTGYLFELDGQRMLAVGDVMAAPGKLHEYYSSQWTYMSFRGHVNLLESLEAIQRLEVDWILPGHGVPFVAVRSLISRAGWSSCMKCTMRSRIDPTDRSSRSCQNTCLKWIQQRIPTS